MPNTLCVQVVITAKKEVEVTFDLPGTERFRGTKYIAKDLLWVCKIDKILINVKYTISHIYLWDFGHVLRISVQGTIGPFSRGRIYF